METFSVYLIQCETKDGAFAYYTGRTDNWEKCWQRHLGKNGAKFTKQYRPIAGVPVYEGLSNEESRKLEKTLKRRNQKEKETLFNEKTLQLL